MAAITSNIEITHELRLCKVGDRYGYFHTWEHYSKPIPADLFIGGAPAGVISLVHGVVEFEDHVERVDLHNIVFVDDQNQYLKWANKYQKKE